MTNQNDHHPNTKSIGKIARLPREVREQLNRRLQNDEPPKDLLEWLNPLPDMKPTFHMSRVVKPPVKAGVKAENKGCQAWSRSRHEVAIVNVYMENVPFLN